jgi:hypothetical protein
MENLTAATKAKIDELYSQACRVGTTYERVVHDHFCEGMVDLFGADEQLNVETQAAFEYARETYGYVTDDDIDEEDDIWAGLCSHGMDSNTCPAGCFEF